MVIAVAELFAAVGWLLRIYAGLFGPLGVLALVVAVLVAAGFVIFAVRQVTSLLGRLFGVREFHLSEWKVTHPASWRWLRATFAVVSLITSARMLAGHPAVGLPLVGVTCSAGWLAVRVAQFWSGYPLSWAGFIAACRTAVTKQALDLVWQSIGAVSVQRGKLRLPRYESWTLAVTRDGWAYGLHCNGFVPPQGTGGLAQIMEACASPGSEYDTITSNLNNILLEPGELRGPLVALLRSTNQLPLYAGATVDRPDGYPAGVGRLTLMHRLPLERVRTYPWRPGYWAGRVRARAAELAAAGNGNPLGKAVAELIAAGVPVGFDADGRIIRVDCDDEHTCLMGATRTGKSTLLECLLHFLVEMPSELVRLAVLDMKGGAHLHGYRARASVFATVPDEAERVIDHLLELMAGRYAHLQEHDLQKITEPTEATPYWYVVIDEGSKLPEELLEKLAALAREGAAAHIIVIFATQYMTNDTGFPRPLDVNLSNRLATRLPDQASAAKAMTRAAMSASCAPHLIRRQPRSRGIFCHSAGGVDPAYAKSMLTGGVRDQRRRTRHAVALWGPPPLLALGPAAPEPIVELVEDEPELLPWGPERRQAMQDRLAQLAAMIASRPDPPDAERITRTGLNRMVNLARRQHNPARLPAGPDRDGVQQARVEIERLARELNTDLQDRDSVAAERDAAVVVG